MATDRAFTSTTQVIYLEPIPENVIGFIVEEAVKQLSGFNRKDNMSIGLPKIRDLARLITFSAGPLRLNETIEQNEPQPTSYVISRGADNITTIG